MLLLTSFVGLLKIVFVLKEDIENLGSCWGSIWWVVFGFGCIWEVLVDLRKIGFFL